MMQVAGDRHHCMPCSTMPTWWACSCPSLPGCIWGVNPPVVQSGKKVSPGSPFLWHLHLERRYQFTTATLMVPLPWVMRTRAPGTKVGLAFCTTTMDSPFSFLISSSTPSTWLSLSLPPCRPPHPRWRHRPPRCHCHDRRLWCCRAGRRPRRRQWCRSGEFSSAWILTGRVERMVP